MEDLLRAPFLLRIAGGHGQGAWAHKKAGAIAAPALFCLVGDQWLLIGDGVAIDSAVLGAA